jgi:hypothetical protein
MYFFSSSVRPWSTKCLLFSLMMFRVVKRVREGKKKWKKSCYQSEAVLGSDVEVYTNSDVEVKPTFSYTTNWPSKRHTKRPRFLL